MWEKQYLDNKIPAAFLGFQFIAQAPRLPQTFAIRVSVSGRQKQTRAQDITKPSSLQADGVMPRGFFFPSFQTSCSANSAPDHSLSASKGFFSPFQPSPSAISSPAKTPASTQEFSQRSRCKPQRQFLSRLLIIPRMVTPLQAKFLLKSLDDDTFQRVIWLVSLCFHLPTQILS